MSSHPFLLAYGGSWLNYRKGKLKPFRGTKAGFPSKEVEIPLQSTIRKK